MLAFESRICAPVLSFYHLPCPGATQRYMFGFSTTQQVYESHFPRNRYCFSYSCFIWQISYIAISRQSREILYNIFGLITGWLLTGAPLNYISLHKSHQKSDRIYLPACTWNFWGAKKDACTNTHACVAKRAMWWLWFFSPDAVCQIYPHF